MNCPIVTDGWLATHYVPTTIQTSLSFHFFRIALATDHHIIIMPPKQQEKKTLVKSEKLTQGEKKKLKNENKAKANPEKAAAKKVKADAKRERR